MHIWKSEILSHLKLKYKIIAKKLFFVEKRNEHLEGPQGNTVTIIFMPKKKNSYPLHFFMLSLFTIVGSYLLSYKLFFAFIMISS